MNPDAEPLLVPVGRLLGTFHERSDGSQYRIVVRLGSTLHRLDDAEFTMWWLTRGLPDRGDTDWTATTVAEIAAEIGQSHAVPTLERLIGTGLVAQVGPGAQDRIAFASGVRVVPDMLGLGNIGPDPGMFHIGLHGRPMIRLPAVLYDLWRWAGLEEHLWNACVGAADIAARAGAPDPDEADPGYLLDLFLTVLHPLLATQAVHLEPGRSGRGPNASGVSDALG